ncbi:MAG: hypothetical protein HC834_06035 [Rhodospirillales bacterium]|nr:hypothetical protein [Rhodospirillales bacterium]
MVIGGKEWLDPGRKGERLLHRVGGDFRKYMVWRCTFPAPLFDHLADARDQAFCVWFPLQFANDLAIGANEHKGRPGTDAVRVSDTPQTAQVQLIAGYANARPALRRALAAEAQLVLMAELLPLPASPVAEST